MEVYKQMKKIMVVFGTRPEAIKMCPVIKELKENNSFFETIVCVTGQHRDMLDQVLKIFDIIPDYDLNIMKKSQNLFDISINILSKIQLIIAEVQPDLILVHGDTSTSFIAALAAFYMHIPVGHVEAGLRTNDIESPFPEEFNRQAISIISKFNFAPTQVAAKNLLKEGKREQNIFVTGNTAIDALKTTISTDFHHKELVWANGYKLILLTAHRRENLGKNMEQIFRAVLKVVEECRDVKVIYPIHMNPQIRELASTIFKNEERIHLIEPLDVIDFHNFMKNAYLILTDSGGIQEEAPALGKPVLVLRNTTERPEGIEAGTLRLVGTDEEIIYQETIKLLNSNKEYESMSKALNPYGDGNASKKIIKILQEKM